MTIRRDMMIPRPGKDGKTYWHKVGSYFETDKGTKFAKFDSLPIPDKDGQITVQFFDPKPRDGARPAAATPAKSPRDEDFGGDEVPF